MLRTQLPLLAMPIKSFSIDSWIPKQHSTPNNLKTRTDCYIRTMIKCPGTCIFHCSTELYYAAILEGDPNVSAYVPQPHLMTIAKKKYTPDFHVMTRSGQRKIVELKIKILEEDEELFYQVERQCYLQGIKFEIVLNKVLEDHHIEAENCLHIIRTLTTATLIKTEHLEEEIYQILLFEGSQPLIEFIDVNDRVTSFNKEVAIYRLLFSGKVTANLAQPLTWETYLCPVL